MQNDRSCIPHQPDNRNGDSKLLKDESSDIIRNMAATRRNDFFRESAQAWEPLGANEKFLKAAKQGPPRFEAYMMTGDLILKLSPQQQAGITSAVSGTTATMTTRHQKKVEMLRMRNAAALNNNNSNKHNNNANGQLTNDATNDVESTYYHHNSVPSSPSELEMGTRQSHHHHFHHHFNHCTTSGTNSADSSPVLHKRNLSSSGGSCCCKGTASNLSQMPASLCASATTCSHCPQTDPSGASGTDTGLLQQGLPCVRTSRSEDHLQFHKDGTIGAVDIDIDDDVTSSLNTLLDTRRESNASNSDLATTPVTPVTQTSSTKSANAASASNATTNTSKSDRIVWTYNAPVSSSSVADQHPMAYINGFKGCPSGVCSSYSSQGTSSSGSNSLRSDSPVSPTSMSSSVMSNQSTGALLHGTAHHSVSEAISNMSSPDYRDDETTDILCARDSMMLSDPSDSDSTILASERHNRRKRSGSRDNNEVFVSMRTNNSDLNDHRIVIQVRGPNARKLSGDKDRIQEDQFNEDDVDSTSAEDPLLARLADGGKGSKGESPSPTGSDDESDIESLHSFHYSPKAVDLPSAIRLAKRLYSLDGFKKSDVSRHLSKNNDFSRAVAEEYLKYFNFDEDSLDVALRKFLKQFSLTGETQERERVLIHFSKRYLDCNAGSFNSQDAVHTLTCAIMLLNTDLHGPNIGRKMTCSEFIENLSELNDGQNFPREILKQLYHAIKNFPLEWALDEDGDNVNAANKTPGGFSGATQFLDVPITSNATEYKKGFVMRKCCYEANGKRTPFGKRAWKMFYCTLRDMVLYLHKDENGFRKSQVSDNVHNAIRIHHALATKANDYTKKQHVFRLQLADQSEYLFQASNSKELQSWMDTINFVAASFSAQPLEGGVGSQKRFQRPLLPCSRTKLSLREQLFDHEERVQRLELYLNEHRKCPPEKGAKTLTAQNYREKEAYLQYELCRYKTYAYLLRSRFSQCSSNFPNTIADLNQLVDLDDLATPEQPLIVSSIGEGDEITSSAPLINDVAVNTKSMNESMPTSGMPARKSPSATNRKDVKKSP